MLAIALIATIGAGCGGDDRPGAVLAETISRLSEIRNGTLALELLVDPEGGGGEIRFQVHGPFSLSGPGELPFARLTYTQSSGQQRSTATFISTGREAFVEAAGKKDRLSQAELTKLRRATEQLQSGGLGELGLERWFERLALSEGGDVGGSTTDRVQGNLNTSIAAKELIELARQLGHPDVGRIRGRTAEELAKAARGRFDLLTGEDDRMLRRLALDVRFGLDVPGRLDRLMPTVVGADVHLEVSVTAVNHGS